MNEVNVNFEEIIALAKTELSKKNAKLRSKCANSR